MIRESDVGEKIETKDFGNNMRTRCCFWLVLGDTRRSIVGGYDFSIKIYMFEHDVKGVEMSLIGVIRAAVGCG